MTRPTARVLALLEILQSGGTRTVGDLADRLGVDERTVRRYAAHLADLGIPVQSVRGRYGGYRLVPGFRLPPLMFTDDEALAVLLGLIAARPAGRGTTSDAAAESAAAKVRRVLPGALAERLDTLLQTTDFTGVARPAVEVEARVLLVLAEAARHRRPVTVNYTSADGRSSERVVHPYGIVSHSGRWYVTGADSAHGEIRTFRADRISGAHLEPGRFERPDDFDPAERVLAGLAEAPRRHEVLLRVRGRPDDVRSRFPAGLVHVVDQNQNQGQDQGLGLDRGLDRGLDLDLGLGLDRGFVLVRLRAERLDWVPGLLAGLDLEFTVEQPEALRELLRSLAGRLLDAARAGR